MLKNDGGGGKENGGRCWWREVKEATGGEQRMKTPTMEVGTE